MKYENERMEEVSCSYAVCQWYDKKMEQNCGAETGNGEPFLPICANYAPANTTDNDANRVLPAVLMSDDGYPTDNFLKFIQLYQPTEEIPIMKFVEILYDCWWMADWGFNLHRKYKGEHKLELHTGGWSGNEDIISAMEDNTFLTAIYMPLVMWKRGGHYYFKIPSGNTRLNERRICHGQGWDAR